MEEIVKGYRTDAALRGSFNRLARATFGLDFEPWYQNGFWGEDYEPYSLLLRGEVVANVSLNRTDLLIGGERRRVFQLGTVMTAPEYRNRGYIRALMDRIAEDTAQGDGVCLFANDSVLDFYPKFGFVPGVEFQYSREVRQSTPCRMARVPMGTPARWAQLSEAMGGSTFPTACRMVDNPGLIFFYASQFLKDCVYYAAHLDAWVIGEWDRGTLLLHEVFCSRDVSLREILEAFGPELRRVTLGFAPADPRDFVCTPLREEDCTFFVRGPAFEDFGSKKLRIPTLAHA